MKYSMLIEKLRATANLLVGRGWAAEAEVVHNGASALDEREHAFKNFHRNLCERFGYTHDHLDWERDQASLIEHIAKKVTISDPTFTVVPVPGMEIWGTFNTPAKPGELVKVSITSVKSEVKTKTRPREERIMEACAKLSTSEQADIAEMYKEQEAESLAKIKTDLSVVAQALDYSRDMGGTDPGHVLAAARSRLAKHVSPVAMYNVQDNRRSWIGSWQTAPLDGDKLTPSDIGRTVIYTDATGYCEAGTLSSYRHASGKTALDTTVWARYSRGDTAAGASATDLCFGLKPLDGPELTARDLPPKKE